MIPITDPRLLLLPLSFDVKLYNYFLADSGVDITVETVPEYLARVDKLSRPTGDIVTVLLPKAGYSAGSFFIDDWISTHSRHFLPHYYHFKGGVEDEHFLPMVFSSPPYTVDGNSKNTDNGIFHSHLLGLISSNNLVAGESPPYGALYNYYAANHVATTGWHLPSMEEWQELLLTLEAEANSQDNQAGGLLKDLLFWDAPNQGATNSFLFNARGSGYRTDGFLELGQGAYFWSSTTLTPTLAYSGALNYLTASLDVGGAFPTSYAMAVRLVCDSDVNPGFYKGTDEKMYTTTKIGNKVWMAENLNETKLNTGEWINGYNEGIYTPITDEQWESLPSDGVCYYENILPEQKGLIPVRKGEFSKTETLFGEVNGINQVFTTSEPYKPGSLILFINGLKESTFTELDEFTISITSVPKNTGFVDEISAFYILKN